MVINMNDARIRAEWVPASISAVGATLRQMFGTAADSVGAQGNEYHEYGFHRSENWVRNSPDSKYRDTDYSLSGALNVSADRNAVCALDYTPGSTSRMITLTKRVYDAARARDPRLANVQEFAGTLNGTVVTRIRCSDGTILNPFDSTHLWHFHASFFRSRALNSHTGFAAVLAGSSGMALDEYNINLAAIGINSEMFDFDNWGNDPAKSPMSQVRRAKRIEAMLSASAARETATLAAIQALAEGGTSVDTGAVIARINAVAESESAAVQALQADLDAVQVQLAVAMARNERLGTALAAAGGALETADDDLSA